MSLKDCCYGSPSCLQRDVSAASIVHKLLSLVNQPADCEQRNKPRRALSLWAQMKAICSIIHDQALFSDNVRSYIAFSFYFCFCLYFYLISSQVKDSLRGLNFHSILNVLSQNKVAKEFNGCALCLLEFDQVQQEALHFSSYADQFTVSAITQFGFKSSCPANVLLKDT